MCIKIFLFLKEKNICSDYFTHTLDSNSVILPLLFDFIELNRSFAYPGSQ